MFRWLHSPDVAALLLRLFLAGVFITQGYLKITQREWGTNWYMGENDTLAPWLQATVAWAELACGVALVLGLLTRVAALGIMGIMLGALYWVTWKLDFTSLPTRSTEGLVQQKVGYDLNYAILIMSACLVILGAGVVSLDHLLWRRRRPEAAAPPAETPVIAAARMGDQVVKTPAEVQVPR